MILEDSFKEIQISGRAKTVCADIVTSGSLLKRHFARIVIMWSLQPREGRIPWSSVIFNYFIASTAVLGSAVVVLLLLR
jgi:hypothetical protein